MPILARYLRDRGIVTGQQLEEAIQHQVLYGGRLGTSLHELGFITEERLQDALARAHGVSTTAIDASKISPEALAAIPAAIAAKHKVCPYKVTGQTLFLLMVNPRDHTTVAKIGFSRGFIVKPIVIPELRMARLLRQHYGVDERWRHVDTFRPQIEPGEALEPEVAGERLDSARTRDEVVDAILGVCHRSFRRVIFLIVKDPWVLGWTGRGEGVDRGLAEGLRFPLGEPSVFQTVARDKTHFIGRLAENEQNTRLLNKLDKQPNTNAVVFPIVLRGRVVNLIYGDSGSGRNVKTDMGSLLLVLQRVPDAYLRIIKERVGATREVAEEQAGGDAGSGS